jgi:hypothetical protein
VESGGCGETSRSLFCLLGPFVLVQVSGLWRVVDDDSICTLCVKWRGSCVSCSGLLISVGDVLYGLDISTVPTIRTLVLFMIYTVIFPLVVAGPMTP